MRGRSLHGLCSPAAGCSFLKTMTRFGTPNYNPPQPSAPPIDSNFFTPANNNDKDKNGAIVLGIVLTLILFWVFPNVFNILFILLFDVACVIALLIYVSKDLREELNSRHAITQSAASFLRNLPFLYRLQKEEAKFYLLIASTFNQYAGIILFGILIPMIWLLPSIAFFLTLLIAFAFITKPNQISFLQYRERQPGKPVFIDLIAFSVGIIVFSDSSSLNQLHLGMLNQWWMISHL